MPNSIPDPAAWGARKIVELIHPNLNLVKFIMPVERIILDAIAADRANQRREPDVPPHSFPSGAEFCPRFGGWYITSGR